MRQLAMTAMALVVLAGPVRADEEKVPLDKVPKAVLETAKKRFPKAEVVGASKETADNKTVYEIELKQDKKTIDVTLTPEGVLTLIEQEIDAKDLPKAVTKTLDEKYPKATYKLVEEVIAVKDGKEALDFYEALLITADKKEIEVQVTPDGKIKSVEEKKEEKKEGKKEEKKSESEKSTKNAKGEKSNDKLPKKVAEAVKATFPGGKVVGIEKEDEDGDVVYEVELSYKATTLEVVLSEKGKVVKVKVKGGKEADEQGEKNQKGEKGEKNKGEKGEKNETGKKGGKDKDDRD